MFWIHGGGFGTGDATDSIYGPGYLLDRDVILVAAQYRLGPMGFLDLGKEEVAGNQGLWDQRVALQWVQKNIASFNGDPNRVTIFGESAGSMSVMYHTLSRNVERLFQAAIPISGEPHTGFLFRDKEMYEQWISFQKLVP
jgi:acetylcholinesterase